MSNSAIPQTACCNYRSLLKLMSSQWCHPTLSSSVIPFSSCLQSFPGSGSFPMSQFSESGGQSIGVSTSASVLPMNIHDWFPLGLISLISLQSKGLSRVFSNTAFCKFKSIKYMYQTYIYKFIYHIQIYLQKCHKNYGTLPHFNLCTVLWECDFLNN